MNPNDPIQNQVQPLPEQNLSSEENYSQDYELYSKKVKSDRTLLIIGVILFIVVSISVGLFYFGIIKF
jgi:hypothetical protein